MDTLATSQKLKLSGISSKHAESITEAIANNESIETKRINKKIDVLDNKIEKLDNKVDEKFDVLDNKIEKLDNKVDEKFNKVDEKFEKLDNKVDEKFNKVDEKFEKLDSKIEKFRTEFTSQSRWIIGLIVTLIIAIGILKFF